jgi:GH24 family phage-related lysozyme (muramidase)
LSNAADICAARIIRTNVEGFRADAYDDATGKPIVAEGVVTVGYGCACRGWSPQLGRAVLGFQLAAFEAPLFAYGWYPACNDARRSALLEIAYNQGVVGLTKGYPRMIAAIQASDWADAAAQCNVRDPNLQARYARIAKIIETGVDQ